MGKRYDPSPMQLQLFRADFAPLEARVMAFVSERQRTDCVPPTRHTSDQYRCATCGIVWDVDETRPNCDTTPYP